MEHDLPDASSAMCPTRLHAGISLRTLEQNTADLNGKRRRNVDLAQKVHSGNRIWPIGYLSFRGVREAGSRDIWCPCGFDLVWDGGTFLPGLGHASVLLGGLDLDPSHRKEAQPSGIPKGCDRGWY
ncbi:hypothetical protein RRG08_028333 [Elysia crispata]|uniref:Uncharacterized protein n=1 Tax=Elysia crispata TaxID=231223 RepID=A0AAE1AYC3_9GAST|nr:hypothetical protein RRG08_028333 [Elysia crispata]